MRVVFRDRQSATCRLLAVTMCTGAMTACAHMQATQSWSKLAHRLSNGATVAVTTADQVETVGSVSAVSSESLTLVIDRAPRRFEAKDVQQVRRDGDPSGTDSRSVQAWDSLAHSSLITNASASRRAAMTGKYRSARHF